MSVARVRPAVARQRLVEEDARGGVYAIWEGTTMRYFGETCHVAHRVLEIVDLGRHHSLNLLMGPKAAGKTGRQKSAWFCRSPLKISWMIVEIGRAELEEYMVLKHAAGLKNHQSVRFGLRHDIDLWRSITKEPNRPLQGTPVSRPGSIRMRRVRRP